MTAGAVSKVFRVTEVAKTVLAAKPLEYLRCVEGTGEDLLVTDNGRPVVKAIAITRSRAGVVTGGSRRQHTRRESGRSNR